MCTAKYNLTEIVYTLLSPLKPARFYNQSGPLINYGGAEELSSREELSRALLARQLRWRFTRDTQSHNTLYKVNLTFSLLVYDLKNGNL